MLPLSGVRILDVTRLLPGGFCSYLLSEFGAEVIKVEEPVKGDYMRNTPPAKDGVSLIHTMVNRNKRSIAIDLKTEQGRAVLERLVSRSDVFLDGFRPGAMDRLGFSFERVRRLNNKIVYCSISAFGHSSPLSQMPGHDINFEAMSGLLASVDSPRVPYVQLGDYSAAFYATLGILASLRNPDRQATFVDVPIVQSLMSLLMLPASAYFATGESPSLGACLVLGSEPYYAIYRTSDRKFLAVAAIEPRFWKNLMSAMGLSRFEKMRDGTVVQRAELRRKMQAVFSKKTRSQWSKLLMHKDTCVTPVLDIQEAIRSDWARSSGAISRIGDREVLNQPIRLLDDAREDRDAPSLGEHSREILAELGYSVAQAKKFLLSGAVA